MGVTVDETRCDCEIASAEDLRRPGRPKTPDPSNPTIADTDIGYAARAYSVEYLTAPNYQVKMAGPDDPPQQDQPDDYESRTSNEPFRPNGPFHG
jgi:hypothetical protein